MRVHWIAHHLVERIQAIDVAKAMDVSQQRWHKAFATYHVRTPGREIRHQRLQVAEHELTQPNDTLEKIAQCRGHETVGTLISNFRAARGMTPSRFRKQHKARRQQAASLL